MQIDEIFGGVLRFIEDKCLILFIGSLVVFLLSYICAYFFYEKRKEVQ